jgi:hypothetical protein
VKQSKLFEHVPSDAFELCPQCLKPLTQYWHTVLIEPYEDSDKVMLTQERNCDNCNYSEQTQVEVFKSVACQGTKENSCDLCVKCGCGRCK